MCNAVSEVYSLYNDGKDVLKGNWTKLPEAVIELNKVLTAVGAAKSSLGRSVKGGYDCFVKNGHSKALDLGEKNSNPIAFVMGLIDSKRNKNSNKVKTYSSFLSGFGTKLAVEGLMDSVINIACMCNDIDYWKEGRNAEKIGFVELSFQALVKILQKMLLMVKYKKIGF